MRGIICANPLGMDALEQRFPNIRVNYEERCVNFLEFNPIGQRLDSADAYLQYTEFPVKDTAGEQDFVFLLYEVERRASDEFLVYPLKVYDRAAWADRAQIMAEAMRIASTGSDREA